MNQDELGTQIFHYCQFEFEPSRSAQLNDVLFTTFLASQCLFLSISTFEEFIIESKLSSLQIVFDFGK